MSLDIHLGSNPEEAEEIYPDLSFEENLHDYLFVKNEWIKKYPLFWKMHDYYKDCLYPNEEIAGLKQEIAEILINVKDKKCKVFLKKLINLCDKSIAYKKNLYCFCD